MSCVNGATVNHCQDAWPFDFEIIYKLFALAPTSIDTISSDDETNKEERGDVAIINSGTSFHQNTASLSSPLPARSKRLGHSQSTFLQRESIDQPSSPFIGDKPTSASCGNGEWKVYGTHDEGYFQYLSVLAPLNSDQNKPAVRASLELPS
jgi:hypothetical protein